MNILTTDKEKWLLNQFAKGDALAMDRLYGAYADYLAGVCHRYIADDDDMKDVLQEAFIKIFTQIAKFKYRGKGSLKAWLTRIVINEALMALRRKGKEKLVFQAESRMPVSGFDAHLDKGGGTIDEGMEALDEPPDPAGLDAETIVGIINKLPAGYREVFNMYAIDGFSHKQIAEQLNITPGTSASQFHKARLMLARMIREYKAKHQLT